MNMQERNVREEMRPRDWFCTILKDLQNIHPYTFKICKNHTKDSWITQESHQDSKKPLADLENHQAHTQSLRKIKPQW